MDRIEKLNRYDWIVCILWSCRDHLRTKWHPSACSWVVEQTYRGLLVSTIQPETTMNQRQNRLSIKCPQCGSNNTQTIETAYTQSVRRSNGYVSISEFGDSISPPEQQSTFPVPLAYAFGSTFISLPVLPKIDDLIDLPLITGSPPINSGNFMIALVIGALAFVVNRRSAVSNNAFIFQELLAAWRRQSVCRRCSHIYLPGEE